MNQNVTDLSSQLASFQASLQTFALRHADEIRQNPQLRSEFAQMCSSIGVDPLVGVNTRKREFKGWNMLGVGEFWIRVATRVVGICRRTRSQNGGFIAVAEVQRILAAEDKLTQQRSGAKEMVISEYATRLQV
jgi:ESCRT-II complex subunit VPS22